MLPDHILRQLLQESRKIAIIGAKDKEGQPVDTVGRYLIAQGYDVFPVHPVRKRVWGREAWPSVKDLPEPVDIIDLFRAPEYCPAHAREVIELSWKPKMFWMQLGIRSPEAGRLLFDAGIGVIEDLCIKIEHARLLGNV